MEKDSEFEQLKMKGRRYSILALDEQAIHFCKQIFFTKLPFCDMKNSDFSFKKSVFVK